MIVDARQNRGAWRVFVLVGPVSAGEVGHQKVDHAARGWGTVRVVLAARVLRRGSRGHGRVPGVGGGAGLGSVGA